MKWILILFSTAALATTEVPQPKVVYKKSEEHKFSALKLKGQLKKPDLSYIYKRKGLRNEQIVNIPESFNSQIVEGADQF